MEVKRSTSDPAKIQCLEELVSEKLGLDIFMAIESAKMSLSKDKEAAVQYQQGGIDILENIKRFEFENYIESYVSEISGMIDDAFNQIKIDYSAIDIVVMVGGSSKIPRLKKIVEDKFPDIPLFKTDIFHSVAYGLSFAD